MNSRLILGLIGLAAISPCIFGQMILDYFQIEGVGEKSSSGMVLNTVVVVLGLLGLAMIILSLSGGTPRAVLAEIRSRSILKHFSEALSIFCILVAVAGGLIAMESEGKTSLIGLAAAVLGVVGWLGFKYISTPTARELAKVSLHHACLWGDVAEIDRHLESGVDINAPDETIYASPLHWICLSGIPVEVARQQGGYIKEEKRLEVVRHLIASGADVNQQITDGKAAGATPLDLARECGENEVAELLEKHGAVSSGLSVGQLESEKPSA